MAKLPPSEDHDEKPRNKRRYDPRDNVDGESRDRDMPRKPPGGRPQDDDEDWEDEDWNDEDLDPDDEDDDR